MRLLGIGNRLRVGLVTVVVLVVGLVSATSGAAAPRDNIRNAALCLRAGGWHTLQTTNLRLFRGPFDCIVYALRGGAFATVTPPAEELPPPLRAARSSARGRRGERPRRPLPSLLYPGPRCPTTNVSARCAAAVTQSAVASPVRPVAARPAMPDPKRTTSLAALMPGPARTPRTRPHGSDRPLHRRRLRGPTARHRALPGGHARVDPAARRPRTLPGCRSPRV